jgi:hypothetical protein
LDFPEDQISNEILYNISYIIFFFGVGENSSKIVLDLIGQKNHPFFMCVEEFIKANKNGWKKNRLEGKKIGINFKNETFTLNSAYMPCNGHMSRLSHYIRNLFQLVKFIDDQDEKIIPYNKKYEYASTLRSQLSNHEQLLLYYNAISVLGKPWIDNGFLIKYCMIKSLPVPLADFYKTPLSWLPEKNSEEKSMFEWTEIKTRIQDL